MAKTRNKKRADGRLQTKIYIGNIDGKAKYKYIYGKTQKELDEKVLEVKMSLKKGIDITADNDTFWYWSEHWLKLKEYEVSTGRFVSYKTWIKKLSVLYDYKIKKLTSADFQNIIIEYNQLAANTLVQIRNTAKQIMQLALDNRIIDYNPVNAVKIPKNK